MSKPIKITEAFLREIQEDFEKTLRSLKMADGKITYTKQFVWSSKEDDVVTLEFAPMAYVKMVSLLQHFSSEVAWHGTVTRDAEDPLHFIIQDILVYPQLVDGTNANTDQAAYTEWLYGLEDEVFNTLKMQGHSHVNMGTSPSTVDLTHQEEILSQLEDDMFYIFMIWNKRLEHTIKVYDLASNTLYEDADIDVVCPDLDDFLDEADALVQKKTTAPAKSAAKTKTPSKQTTPGYGSYDGWPYYGRYPYGYGYEDDPLESYRYGYGDYDDEDDDPAPATAGKSGKKRKH